MSNILKEYAKTHEVPINVKSVSCVDGRQYKASAKSIKRPGADLGETGGLLYLIPDLDGVKAIDDVANACRKIGRPAFAHTDTHDNTRGTKDCGCGHIKYMMTTSDYGIDQNEMIRAYKIAIQNPLVRWWILEGDHQEEGVIVNNKSGSTVVNHNPNKEQMFYVYDAYESARDLYLLTAELRRADHRTYQRISNEALNQAIEMQLGITLTKLRGKNGVFASEMPSITVNPHALLGLIRGVGRIISK